MVTDKVLGGRNSLYCLLEVPLSLMLHSSLPLCWFRGKLSPTDFPQTQTFEHCVSSWWLCLGDLGGAALVKEVSQGEALDSLKPGYTLSSLSTSCLKM